MLKESVLEGRLVLLERDWLKTRRTKASKEKSRKGQKITRE